MQLVALDTAQTIEDMDIPGFKLHALKGKLKGRWAIWVVVIGTVQDTLGPF